MNKILYRFIEQLRKKSNFSLASDGHSMMPMLKPNDILFFKKIDFSRCKINDLVLIQKRGKTFTHRIIYKTNNYVISKGDNNLTSDGKIYPHQIIGKVHRVNRNGQVFNPENLYLIQSSLYFQEIVKIKKTLEKKNIGFVFLKGLPLHIYFEKSHPKRIYADCDILVKKDVNTNIRKTLENAGYQFIDTSYSQQHKILKDKLTELMFIKKIGDFPVVLDVHLEANFLMNQLGELNWVYPQKMINQLTADFFTTKRLIKIQDNQFFILASCLLPIYLSLHFFHHNFRGIYRLDLINRIVSNELTTNHWNQIQEIIVKYKLQNYIYPTFLFLQKYYYTRIPENFIEIIRSECSKLDYIKDNILKINVFDDEPRMEAGINRFKNIFYLSPYPLWRKIWIFLNPAVIYSIIWAIQKRILFLKAK